MGRTIWLLHWKQVGRYIHFQDSWIRTTGSSVAQQIFFRREAMSHGWTARSQKQTAGREFATSWVAWLAPPTSASSLMAGCGPYGGLACLGSALPSFSFSCSTRSHWPIILLPSLVCALLALFHVRKICFWACHRRRRLLSSIPAAALLELDGWGGSRLVRKSLKQAFFAFLYPVAVWRPAKSNLSTPVGKLPTFSQPSAAWPSALQRNFPWSALKRKKILGSAVPAPDEYRENHSRCFGRRASHCFVVGFAGWTSNPKRLRRVRRKWGPDGSMPHTGNSVSRLVHQQRAHVLGPGNCQSSTLFSDDLAKAVKERFPEILQALACDADEVEILEPDSDDN